MDQESEIKFPEEAGSPQTAALVFDNVTFTYEDTGIRALNGVSFMLKPGQKLGVLGATGSGKTTLCNLVPRLVDPTGGEILFDGKPLKEYGKHALRDAIGYAPQDVFLFSNSISENVAFGKPGASGEEVTEACKSAGIYESIMRFPEGLDTVIGERGVTLSGGQKQRLALARAWIRKPRLLILDDSLSAVDTRTEEVILGNLRRARTENPDMGVIMVSHRVSTIQDSDLILVLEDGEISEAGTHDELLGKKGYYSVIYQKQLIEEEMKKRGYWLGLRFFGKIFAVNWENRHTMKAKFSIAAMLLIVFTALQVVHAGGDDEKVQLRVIPNNTFKSGEKLEFRVHYGMVTAGRATLEVKPDPVTMHGRKCYHVVGKGVSSKSFSLFFKVRDTYETYLDTESIIPWKFKRDIREGGFKSYTVVDFDHYKHMAYERKDHKGDIQTYQVPANIQDVLSAFYYARTMDYSDAEPGQIYRFQNFIDQQVFNLDVKFIGYETIKVSGSKYRCVKLQPLVEEGGLFQHEGDLHLWITADENRIPVRIESGLVIGAIQVDLVKATGLKHPLKSRIG